MKSFLMLLVGLLAAGRAEPSPELPAPQLTLRVETSAPGGLWKLVVTNAGAIPLRFAADGRLLTLQIESSAEQPVAGGKKAAKTAPIECRLPADMRPSDVAEDRRVVLPPHSRYEETIDPELYCFGARERTALAAGTRLIPKLGFPSRATKTKLRRSSPPSAPFLAEPIAAEPSVAALKEIIGAPFVVPPTHRAPKEATAPSLDANADPGAANLQLSTPARIETASADSASVPLVVKNTGTLRALVRARPDQFLFEVDGPNGPFRCGAPSSNRTIPRDLLTPLRGGSSESLVIRLVEPCPNDAFDRPGLYRIRPTLVLNDSVEGARVWKGTVTSHEVTLMRMRTGSLPYYRTPAVTIPEP